MAGGAKKRKASKKKNKKGESLDSNNQHPHGNDPSHGSVDRDSEEEEIVDQLEVAIEENPIVVPASEEEEVGIEQEEEKLVIAEYAELEEENQGIVDCVEEEVVVESNIDDGEEEDLVKEEVELAPEDVASAEGLVMLVQADAVDSELTENVDSSFSQFSEEKGEVSSVVVEAQESEQVEDPVKAVLGDGEETSSEAPAASNGAVNGGKPLETDNLGAAVVVNTSRAVENGKELEYQKSPSEVQPPIGSNPLPIRKTSWMGCCGLFEAFSGSNR